MDKNKQTKKKQIKTFTSIEPTGTLRNLPGTGVVARFCFDRGRRARGGVLWTGRATL